MFSLNELDSYRPSAFIGLRHLQYATFDPYYFRLPKGTYTGARLEGMNYERKVHQLFSDRYCAEARGPVYVPAMWIRYVDTMRSYYAQPDGLIVDLRRSFITIIEIKLKHTLNAYFWLRELYEPLIRHIFGNSWKYAVCEVVKWFDASLRWPEPLRMTGDPSALIVNEFGLHICKA